MLGSSRKVRRLEKEAILRAKDYEYTRGESDRLLSSLNINSEDDDADRHRRHITTRPIRQIQKELDYPVETLDKITERIQQEVKKRQGAAAASPSKSANRSYQTSLSSSFVNDRVKNDNVITGKYSSNKQTNTSKPY
ncbi:unnamed protein product [Rotaria magnacalcarata]|uniref:Uncharacterized protein n=1 Tax=Rotaria magnacalcarata TaxID=392030 RepID=A0A816X7K7_9BILA|nr:unnamed protein product [Rotaria magnacalcarata]CAF1478880.1 unnamed protein product [Rotaria magnacalcarata]CAF2065209.1 unnamed protein product [Rotaria magnacalcarata]CAF2124356.1 unnamed protein product [Rotaria magnacalcarata]CAF2142735.1 unnamed protein product [Rotaria magnacalcarata]